MANSLSEGFARMTYTGESGIHHAMYPLNFDGTPTPGVEPSVVQKDTTVVLISVAIDNLLDVVAPLMRNDTLFGLVEVYAVDADDEERHFIYAFDAGRAGSGGVTPNALTMATLTFKTTIGGVLRMVLMEGILGNNQKIFPPYNLALPALDDLADFVTGDDGWIIGRDNAYPFVPISTTVKTSDALRKRIGI